MTKTKEVYKTIEIEGASYDVYKLPLDVNGNKRYVVSFEQLGIEASDYKDIKHITKYRGRWIDGHVFQSVDLENDLRFYIDTIKEFYHDKNKRKIVMSEYHAYGRRCGFDFIIMENNKRLVKTFYGTRTTNEVEASNEYVKQLQKMGVTDWDSLDIEKRF